MAAVAKREAVGWRVRVFWEGEGEWFEGVITEYSPENGYFVQYDDGEQQWEEEDPALIQFVDGPQRSEGSQLILQAEEEEEEGGEEGSGAQRIDKWSAQPPPSTNGYDDGEYEDEYEQDHEGEEEEEGEDQDTHARVRSPQPEQEEVEKEKKREIKPSSAAVVPLKQARDPAKYVKSGVFFRDPETLNETKAMLRKEKHALTKEVELFTSQLQQKEQLSASIKGELHGLKAQVTLSSLTGGQAPAARAVPKTAKDWAERLVEEKTANRNARQQLGALHTQLTTKQTTLQLMQQQKEQLTAKLARVPRKELCSLVDVQLEIAQLLSEKRDLESQLAQILTTEKGLGRNKTTESERTTAQDQRDAKTELEKQLRQLEKQLLRVRDDVDQWRFCYEKENAKINPIKTRLASLQQQLHTYERSQVLLRSVFLRVDRKGVGAISMDAALEAFALLVPSGETETSPQQLRDKLRDKNPPSSLDYAAFAACFQQLF